ncbi:competence/damage-inducible protein A [Elioraea sp. Yellowstone]|jgi:molybdenum cofactor synthesis domain-containing protein|uniref:competence/damage-inducible protein A n=1 Tax=Elioraea sp. Yellowstone TaxID=2592070 RepID=UPI0011515233|nr:molybdopterin-binding protein [Elioraea sp. Yellowstone]TQF80790.1 competence/damage-inducible protein A [Elioraea sp. Yellowstone]
MTADDRPTAALIIIGDEVLSGRTQDVNARYLATRLGELGIRLREVRIIPDDRSMIVSAVNELRRACTYVFTTGGIGPTHDDITSECIAEAFGLPWEPHPEAWELLARDYASRTPPVEFNAARQRMATMPRGAELIRNAVSVAPGFRVENVHVLAGVPKVMQAMFETLAPTLKGGRPTVSRTVHAARALEGQIAEGLAAIQAESAGVTLGSYPYYRSAGGGVAIVARGTDAAAVEAAAAKVRALFRRLGFEPRDGEPE